MKIVEFKDYDNQTTPLSAYNLNRLQQNLITTKYQMTFSSAVSGGGTITLPCYYQVGQDTLDVYLNSELLKKASTKDSEGHYYEVGNSDTKSNQIKITSDWSIASGDVLNLIVRGTTDSYDQNLSPDKATQLADEISANKEEITALQTENSRLIRPKIANQQKVIDQLPQVTGQGTSITLENTIEAQFTKFDVEGHSEQETTEGYNSLNCSNLTEQTIQGVKFTPVYENRKLQYINVNGTNNNASAAAAYQLNQFEAINGQAYTISGVTGYTANTLQIFSFSSSAFGVGNRLQSYNGATTRTATADETFDVKIQVGAGVTINNVRIYPMIVQGSVEKDYEPYTHGASPNPNYEQPVKSCGENVNEFDGIFRQGNVNGNTNVTTQIFDDVNYEVISNEAYTISTNLDTIIYQYQVFVNNNTFPKSNTDPEEYVSGWKTTTSFTFALSVNGYFGVGVSRIDGGNLTPNDVKDVWFKFEKGNKASGYSPYGMGSINEKIQNKNLFDKDNANIIHAWFLATSAVISSKSDNDTIIYVPCQPNTTYTVSKLLEPNTSKNTLVLGTTSDTPTYGTTLNVKIGVQGGSLATRTITTGANDKYLCAFCYTKNMSNTYSEAQILDSIQIEQGTTATDYIAHKEQTISIPTQQPMRSIGDVRDGFAKVNGVWNEKHLPYIASYNGETLPTDVYTEEGGIKYCNSKSMSTTGQFSIGASVQYIDENNWNYLPCTEEQIQQLENIPSTYKDFTIIQSQDETPAYLEVSGIYDLNNLINN